MAAVAFGRCVRVTVIAADNATTEVNNPIAVTRSVPMPIELQCSCQGNERQFIGNFGVFREQWVCVGVDDLYIVDTRFMVEWMCVYVFLDRGLHPRGLAPS